MLNRQNAKLFHFRSTPKVVTQATNVQKAETANESKQEKAARERLQGGNLTEEEKKKQREQVKAEKLALKEAAAAKKAGAIELKVVVETPPQIVKQQTKKAEAPVITKP